MNAVRMVLRSSMRRRPWSVAVLATVVAVVVGVAVAGVGGAIRTATAVGRMDRQVLTSDLLVKGFSPELGADPGRGEALARALEQVDGVEGARVASGFPVDVVADDYFQLYASPDGALYRDSDRPVLQRGRLPAPDEPDEIVVNETAVQRMGIDVGSSVDGPTIAHGGTESLFTTGEFPGFTGPQMHLRVVGVVTLPSDLSDRTVTGGIQAIGSTAFIDAYGDRMDSYVTYVYLDTVDTSPELVQRVVAAAGGEVGDYEVDVATTDEMWRDDLSATLRTAALIVAAVTGLAVLAGLLVAVQWIRREVLVGTAGDDDLRALGMTRRERTIVGAGSAIVAVAIGSVVGLVAAVAASGAFPFGVARPVEVDPGVRIEAVALLLGLLVAAALVGVAYVAGRRMTDLGGGERPAPSRVSARLSRWGVPAPAAIGAELALEPGRGRRAIPTRSAILGAVVAVAGVSAMFVVARSADAVIEQPERYGYTWTALPDILSDDPEALVQETAQLDGIAGLGDLAFAPVGVDGATVPAMALTVHSGSIRLNVTDGRVPVSNDEVAVSQAFARDKGVRVGDTLAVDPPDGGEPTTLQVVGTVVGPPIDGVARELVLTPEAMTELGHGVGDYAALRFEPDADVDAMVDQLTDMGFRFTASTWPQAPGEVSQFHSLRSLFLAATVLVVVLGAAGLVHVLAISTRRRRGDLAVLRALGFVRRDVRRTLSTQAVVTVLVGVGVGIPLGVAVAESAWRLAVAHLGIVDRSVVPWPGLIGVSVLSLLGATVLSLPLARDASHRSIAGVLRAE